MKRPSGRAGWESVVGLLVAVVVAGWGAPVSAQPPGFTVGDVTVSRVAGDDRVATAVEISRRAYSSAPAAVVARADDGADALTAAPLAHDLGGPLLLVPGDQMPESVAEELVRLGVGEVVFMGGTQAVTQRVSDQLAVDYRVRRVAGVDRFETSAQVARLLRPRVLRIRLAAASPDGSGSPDALAAAPVAASTGTPVMLVERDRIPESVRAAIYELASRQPARVLLIGGTDVISQAVEDDLGRNADFDGDFPVDRIAGANRYETAALLYDGAVADPRRLLMPAGRWLASGSRLDALAAGPAIAALGETLLLVDGDDLTAQPAPLDRLRSRRDLLSRVVLVGGEAVIGADAEQELREALLQDNLDAPRCAAERLRAALQPADGATGNQLQTVEIVNVGEQVCTLEGRPEVQLLDDDGKPVATSVRYDDHEVAAVPLAAHGRLTARSRSQPGQAGVGLAYRTQGDDTCGPGGSERVVTATAVEIGLPSGGRLIADALDDTAQVSTCEGRLTVTPIRDADLVHLG